MATLYNSRTLIVVMFSASSHAVSEWSYCIVAVVIWQWLGLCTAAQNTLWGPLYQ